MVARGTLEGLKVSVLAALPEEPLMGRSLRSASAGVCLAGAAGSCADGYQRLCRT